VRARENSLNSAEHSGLPAEQELKQCCAQLYSSDAVRFLLGDSFHPGGLELTGQVGRLLELGPSSHVLDVASGQGTSAIFLASNFGCSVTGVDLSSTNIERAEQDAAAQGLADRVHFVLADSEQMPFPNGSFDAVICECAFCTFPDKPRAAAEFARVLRSGGRVGLSDLTRGPELPEELRGLLAWVACIADALPVDEYAGHLRSAGLVVRTVEPHDDALRQMVRQIQGRILAAEIASGLKKLDLSGFDLAEARKVAIAAHDAIKRGQLGYSVVVAEKP